MYDDPRKPLQLYPYFRPGQKVIPKSKLNKHFREWALSALPSEIKKAYTIQQIKAGSTGYDWESGGLSCEDVLVEQFVQLFEFIELPDQWFDGRLFELALPERLKKDIESTQDQLLRLKQAQTELEAELKNIAAKTKKAQKDLAQKTKQLTQLEKTAL